MEVTPGFGSDLVTKKVCKLKKTLCILKQFPRAWFRRFAKVRKNMRYKQSEGDHMFHQALRFKGSYSSFGVCR